MDQLGDGIRKKIINLRNLNLEELGEKKYENDQGIIGR
jgi:hypothetical protein